MAPNLKDIISIVGKTSSISLTNTTSNVLLNNPSNSNAVLKINTIIVANIDTSNAINFSLRLHQSANGGGTALDIVPLVSVPAGCSVIALDRESYIYLEENQSLTIVAGAANKLRATISYEEIS